MTATTNFERGYKHLLALPENGLLKEAIASIAPAKDGPGHALSPQSEWSVAEEDTFRDLISQFGHRWHEICQEMKKTGAGRTADECAHHFYSATPLQRPITHQALHDGGWSESSNELRKRLLETPLPVTDDLYQPPMQLR